MGRNSRKRNRSRVASNSQELKTKDATPLEKLRKTENELSESVTGAKMDIEEFNGIHMGTTIPLKKKRGKKSAAADLDSGDVIPTGEANSSQSKGGNSQSIITSGGDNSSQQTENSQHTIPEETNQQEAKCENEIMYEGEKSKDNETKNEIMIQTEEIVQKGDKNEGDPTMSMEISDFEVAKEEMEGENGNKLQKETEKRAPMSLIKKAENTEIGDAMNEPGESKLESNVGDTGMKNHDLNGKSSVSCRVDGNQENLSNIDATKGKVQKKREDVADTELEGSQSGSIDESKKNMTAEILEETARGKGDSVTKEEVKVATNVPKNATQVENLTSNVASDKLLKQEITSRIMSNEQTVDQALEENKNVDIQSDKENTTSYLESTKENIPNKFTGRENLDSHQTEARPELTSPEAVKKLNSKSKSFNMEDKIIIKRQPSTSKSLSEGNMSSQEGIKQLQRDDKDVIGPTTSLSDGQVRSTQLEGDLTEELQMKTSASGSKDVSTQIREILSQTKSESETDSSGKDVGLQSEGIHDTDGGEIDTQPFIPKAEVESQTKAGATIQLAATFSVSAESVPTDMEYEEITDSQLCSVDWDNGLDTPSASTHRQATSACSSEPARVVAPCPVPAQPSELARVVAPCPVPAQPNEPADGTKVVQGLIKELTALNQTLIKTRREIETARKNVFK